MTGLHFESLRGGCSGDIVVSDGIMRVPEFESLDHLVLNNGRAQSGGTACDLRTVDASNGSEHALDVGGTTGCCLLSPTGGGIPGAELCVGRVASVPANTPDAAHQCVSPGLGVDAVVIDRCDPVQSRVNSSTLQVAASRGKRKLNCMSQYGDEVLGKNFRTLLTQPSRGIVARLSAASEQRAVESLLARGVRK